MEKLDIILTVMIAGYGLILSLMLIMWNRIGKIEDRISNIETRLAVIETILHMKECCMIKDDRKLPKAE